MENKKETPKGDKPKKSTRDMFHREEMLTLQFIPNNKAHEAPIARERGIICFIDRNYKDTMPVAGETWFCGVKKINDNCLIVVPIASSNSINANAKVPMPSEKKKKTQNNYKYHRSDEVKVAARRS